MARPSGDFDASRYFRGAYDLGFFNVGTSTMRALARSIDGGHRHWTIDDAMAFAEIVIVDRHLEAKSVGIEVVARHRRAFTPALLPRWKRWFARNHSANWATTDSICGALIGPLLVGRPRAAARLRSWSTHPNMWVRRASIVGLIPLARKGVALDQVYGVARRLHADGEDLIQKAVGWALREAGKADPARLERYLRANGPRIPRTTLRYAIERFPPRKRAQLLRETR
jgi:3-methyladenine DNA glycosylase AlkD